MHIQDCLFVTSHESTNPTVNQFRFGLPRIQADVKNYTNLDQDVSRLDNDFISFWIKRITDSFSESLNNSRDRKSVKRFYF